MINSDNQLESDYLYKENICYLCDKLEDIRQKNTFFIFSCYHFTYHVFRWIEKWVVLKLNCFSKYKKEEFMMYLCFLNIDKNYKSHMSLNLINEVWFQKKWVKTQALINNECESMSMINTKYVQK